MNFRLPCRHRWPRCWTIAIAWLVGAGAGPAWLAAGEGRSAPKAAAGAPSVAIARDGAGLRIGFTGILESAVDARGPWLEVSNAVSPLEQLPTGPQRYFRARGAAAESIFSSPTVASLTLEGPLQTHFDLAFAGLPDGIIPPRREKPYFDGTVRFANFHLPAQVRVRGNSSLQECPFPKLKFKISRDDRAGTPFADAREIKIGTHCAEGGRGTIGRLRDQTAAFREALAYEAMTALGFTAPRVRRAHFDYRDTSPTNSPNPTGWQLERDAFILEDIEVVAERLGGRALDDEEVAELTDAGFDEELITALRLLHALLGNWDYALSVNGRELWNTEVIALPGGRYLPMAGDFDLASWVTEIVRAAAPRDYHPELGDVEREARYRIEQIQEETRDSSFAAARERFLRARADLESLVATAEVDAPGRANAARHLAAFYGVLAFP